MKVSSLSKTYLGDGYRVELLCSPRSSENIITYVWRFEYLQYPVDLRSVSNTRNISIIRDLNGTKVTCRAEYDSGEIETMAGVFQVV